MNQLFEKYIEQLVKDVINKLNINHAPKEQKDEEANKIKRELQSVVLETVLRNFSDQQLQTLKELDFSKNESIDKLTEMITEVPDLDQIVKEKLEQKVQELIANTK